MSLKKILKKLKTYIYPKLYNAATNLQAQRSGVNKHSQKFRKALTEQAEAIHNEIDTIIKDMQSEIDDMDAQHLAAIYKQEKEIDKSIDEITQDILNLQNLLNSDDVCLVTVYTSRIEEFSFPFQLNVTLPAFIPQEINKEQICKHIWIRRN